MKKCLLTLGAVIIASSVWAQDQAISTEAAMSFDDATFALENAIVNRGLVVDYVSHVGEMLERTRAETGSETVLFNSNAQIYVFCSAVESREAMEADLNNIAFCPYNIFVYEDGDGVVMGYQNYPSGPMDDVETMLGEIVADALAE